MPKSIDLLTYEDWNRASHVTHDRPFIGCSYCEPIVFPNGKNIWGNGKFENNPWEAAIARIIAAGGFILDVGSGRYKVHASCIGIDAYTENDSVNVKAYMWEMPFDDDSVDGIFCFHSLEHISKYQVMPTLREFKRVIKPNKPILLLVPDLIWILEAFIKTPNSGYPLDMIYGVQTHGDGTLNEGEFHRTGFTEEILEGYLGEVGLKLVEKFKVSAYNQYNIGALVTKEAD